MPAGLSKDLQDFLATPEPPRLGPQTRAGVWTLPRLDQELTPVLERLSINSSQSALAKAAILLWHDHLDEAHTIAQDIETSDGSLLHAIMHRREPDYGNSKYWLRRAGHHPAYELIGQRVLPLLPPDSEWRKRLLSGQLWDPFAFVDLVAESARHSLSPAQERALRDLQRVETECFLDSI